MVSTEFKGVGLHDTAFRDAIREDSRQTTPSRGVTPRKKFAIEANVESRANRRTLKRTNTLITSIERNGYDSTGKPELLMGQVGT